MASLKRPGRGVCVNELGNQIYLFQSFHKIDISRVLDKGPWHFDRHLLVMRHVERGCSKFYASPTGQIEKPYGEFMLVEKGRRGRTHGGRCFQNDPLSRTVANDGTAMHVDAAIENSAMVIFFDGGNELRKVGVISRTNLIQGDPLTPIVMDIDKGEGIGVIIIDPKQRRKEILGDIEDKEYRSDSSPMDENIVGPKNELEA
ncbi:conserved hypothetical protein [Ricinus communis]|uniref:DUF4283 domain-containing protein n=1 Tax=Ricinus communis TaxID=3988 RepID=B9S3S3_RICCO|nr:conserved hypothetical protein [Ricinus communis]